MPESLLQQAASSAQESGADEVIGVAQALEQRRALTIAGDVADLGVLLNGPFKAGFEMACEEITRRLRTEVWELCLPPVDAR